MSQGNSRVWFTMTLSGTVVSSAKIDKKHEILMDLIEIKLTYALISIFKNIIEVFKTKKSIF